MAYSPMGYEDLYLCTVIPEHVVDDNVDEIENLNSISNKVIIVDIILIFGFLKFVEIDRRKKLIKY